MQTEYYRLYAEELHNKLLQIKQFVYTHNLTIGQFAEDLLRDLLEKLLRVVINVLTNLKRFHRPVSSSLSI